MNKELRAVADNIIDAAIKAVLPDEAVKRTLNDTKFDGKVILVAVGKAAWQMERMDFRKNLYANVSWSLSTFQISSILVCNTTLSLCLAQSNSYCENDKK